MKQFIKDGNIAGYMVIIDGRQVYNPTEDILREAGYEECTPPQAEQVYDESKITNEDIRLMRQDAYKQRSDSFYMAYQKYLAKGETERAEQAKTDWLEEIARIELELPYKEEENS